MSMRIQTTEPAKKTGALLFGTGILVGLLAAWIFVVTALLQVQQSGIKVHVETKPIAAQVATEVRAAVSREVPVALAAMKQELPRRVAEETAKRLSTTTVNVAGFNVPVPEAAAAQISAGVEQAVRAGLDVAVTQKDLNALTDRLSAQAGAQVHEKINAYLSGKTFDMEPWPGFKIPVTVVTR